MNPYPDHSHENAPVINHQFFVPNLKTAEDCLALAQQINPRKEVLTVAILRRFPGCEQYSDEEAAEIIEAINQLTEIIFKSIYENDSILIGRVEQGGTKEAIPINCIEPKNLAA